MGCLTPVGIWRPRATMCRMPPRPGDRSHGFFIEPSRCWAFVYDHNNRKWSGCRDLNPGPLDPQAGLACPLAFVSA
jgi:hypothetical protein